MARASVTGQNNFIPQIQQEEETVVDTTDFSAGWLGDVAERNIPDNGFQYIKNFVYLRGRFIVLNGMAGLQITPPDTNKILNVNAFFDVTTGLNLMRYTKDSIYKLQSNGFIEFTPDTIPAISGTDVDYFSFASVDNRFFFSNNGTDPIRELDPVAQTYKQFGNAPNYRYITSAFDRVIGANLVDAVDIPTQWGWSGAFNYDEFDPSVDISAGFQQLVVSPSDTSDDITGIFNYSTFLVLSRERTIWIAQHQASATNPFNVFAKFPNLGMDTPRTICKNEKGLIWYSRLLGQILYWEPPNGEVRLLNMKIKTSMRNILQQSSGWEYFGSFNPTTYTYSLFALDLLSTCLEFQYSFIYDNWVLLDHNTPAIPSAVYDLSSGFSSITIDELSGTIDDLEGTIDQLGGITAEATRIFGMTEGDIYFAYPYSGDTNEPNRATPDDDPLARTKKYEIPIKDCNFSLIRIEFVPYSRGTVTLTVYKANGNTISKSQVIDLEQLNEATEWSIQIKKSIKTKWIYLEISSEDIIFQLTRVTIMKTTTGVSPTGANK